MDEKDKLPAYSEIMTPPPAYNKNMALPDIPPAYDEIKFIRDNKEVIRDNAEIIKIKEELEQERRARERSERERVEERNIYQEREKLNQINTYNKVAAERALLRPLQPSEYDRLFNWSLTLLPSYYDYVKRQRLSNLLANLIENELRENKSENELKDKIYKLIGNKDATNSFKKLNTDPQAKVKKVKSRIKSRVKKVKPKAPNKKTKSRVKPQTKKVKSKASNKNSKTKS